MSDWQDRAACRGLDPDVFFPETEPQTREAKAVCAGCPVRQECLEHALVTRETHGVWGGTSPKERKRLWSGKPRKCRHCDVLVPYGEFACKKCQEHRRVAFAAQVPMKLVKLRECVVCGSGITGPGTLESSTCRKETCIKIARNRARRVS